MATTRLIPLHLRTDITATLARLRVARTVNAESEILCAERRLDWLLGEIQTTRAQTSTPDR